VALDVHGQRLVLVLALARSLGQVYMHDTLALWAFNVKSELEVLGAPLVRLTRRGQVPISCDPRPRVLAVRGYLVAGAKERLDFGVCSDEVGSAIEVGCFGRGREDVGEEKIAYGALRTVRLLQHYNS
jgi:hypothetical protein